MAGVSLLYSTHACEQAKLDSTQTTFAATGLPVYLNIIGMVAACIHRPDHRCVWTWAGRANCCYIALGWNLGSA